MIRAVFSLAAFATFVSVWMLDPLGIFTETRAMIAGQVPDIAPLEQVGSVLVTRALTAPDPLLAPTGAAEVLAPAGAAEMIVPILAVADGTIPQADLVDF